MCSPACSTSVPTVMATAAGTPALAIPLKSCRRVIATSVLFLVRWLLGCCFQLLCVRAVGGDAWDARLHAAVESLRCYPRRSAHGPCNGADQRCRANFQLARRAEDRRIGVRRSREMDRDRIERAHPPHDALFCAADARDA